MTQDLKNFDEILEDLFATDVWKAYTAADDAYEAAKEAKKARDAAWTAVEASDAWQAREAALQALKSSGAWEDYHKVRHFLYGKTGDSRS